MIIYKVSDYSKNIKPLNHLLYFRSKYTDKCYNAYR